MGQIARTLFLRKYGARSSCSTRERKVAVDEEPGVKEIDRATVGVEQLPLVHGCGGSLHQPLHGGCVHQGYLAERSCQTKTWTDAIYYVGLVTKLVCLFKSPCLGKYIYFH